MSTKINDSHNKKNSLLLLFASILIALLAQVFTASPARAECVYEGETYQTGDTVGPLICMPDGTWQPQ
ncbi:MAG: hypothetical protein EDM05_63285 [Leptolyngbya sp. IPPAS B-1204]|uniref:Uncharacterized protein n=1 Tax=Leptolyngbya sp. NK1-12 TaxID=2547451 RepID=A0AA96WH58_9CYAN|nr:hypothetical protein [Leptolyngbya sp. NK1-12]MBF2051256.1 hypothetical protein [Elainella sp. C42_A2020_010]WNZ25403.1 hypothetical protein HJG54_22815 [Leptolyngbya sp. NK1-12]